MKQSSYFLGIDVGGTKIKTVVLDEKGKILGHQERPTGDHTGSSISWQNQIKHMVFEQKEELSKNEVTEIQVGICAPGLVDSDHRRVVHMPKRLKGIEDFDFSQALGQEAWLINDGHAAALAEYESFYRQQGVSNMIMLTLGTGVGGAIIIDKEIYQGQLQRAGHFGHMTINHQGPTTMTNMVGSLEHAIGNFSVQERTMGRFSDTKELLDAYREGNVLANHWWLTSVQCLATALASLINILSPECIILGGGIAAGAQELLMDPLQEFMSIYEWRPAKEKTPIYLARHGKFAGAIGAAYYAKTKSSTST